MTRDAWAIVMAGLAIAFLLLLAVAAWAAPPENADPALAPWFKSLTVPGTQNGSCCDVSDCRPVAWRIVGDHYEALLNHETFPIDLGPDDPPLWVEVPNKFVLKGKENPTGRAVLCYLHRVFCFVLPDMT